ncbi:MAG: C39 family peptidase [Candidatus Aenigmarchaeota archaeon]|nr:C39 family peptidase [Candidatus Aenigmarchaeota archaeon]
MLRKMLLISALFFHLVTNITIPREYNIEIHEPPPFVQTVNLTFCGENNTFNKDRCTYIKFYQDNGKISSKQQDAKGFILSIEYKNQGSFEPRDEKGNVCDPNVKKCKYRLDAAGCAPVSLSMATGIDPYELWDMLFTRPLYGTSKESVSRVTKELGINLEEGFNISYKEIKRRIDEGNPIILNIFVNTKIEDGQFIYPNPPWPAYANERYCGPDKCYPGGHWVLIVGYVRIKGEDYIVIHDPHTDRIGDSIEQKINARKYGKFLVVSRKTLEKEIYKSKSNFYIVLYRNSTNSLPSQAW